MLLLDEPARGLDPMLRGEFYEVLRQVSADFSTPILLVTHSLDEAFELGEQLIILNEGRIVQSGAPAAVADRPVSLEVARLLGSFNILPVEIRSLDPSRRLSVLRYGEFDITGPYFPGHLIGDRVHVCIAPQRVAGPAEGRAARAEPDAGPGGPDGGEAAVGEARVCGRSGGRSGARRIRVAAARAGLAGGDPRLGPAACLMRRYYITDSRAAGGFDPVLRFVERAIADGVEMIQVREKHLSARELFELTRRVLALAEGSATKILVNTRVDIALSAGASGVHFPPIPCRPGRWREIAPLGFLIGVSCHTVGELREAEAEGADFAVYGPVFPSPGKGSPIGIEGLAEGVCATGLPVYALGGIDKENAAACLHAGAAGVAAISLFQRA